MISSQRLRLCERNLNYKKLYGLVRGEPTNYYRYMSSHLKMIGYPGFPNTDCYVNLKEGYGWWINNYHTLPVIKVEGLEDNPQLVNAFELLDPKDIHLFIAQRTGHSFKWHKDTLDVFLYVIRGYKRVFLKNQVYTLGPGQGVVIPRGHLHKVFSRKGTWALSVGV